MELSRTMRREEISKNFEKTLTLLRSTKQDSADLMLEMLNESIKQMYGDSKPLIDITRFTKLHSDDSLENETENEEDNDSYSEQYVTEEATEESSNENDLNKCDVSPKNKEIIETKYTKNKKTNQLNKNYTLSDTKIATIRKKTNEMHEKKRKHKLNKVTTTEKFENTYNKINTNLITNNEKNSENINEMEGIKIFNSDFFPVKTENGHPASPNMCKKNIKSFKPTMKEPINKVKSQKKLPLHELSSRQRIQAILKKGIK